MHDVAHAPARILQVFAAGLEAAELAHTEHVGAHEDLGHPTVGGGSGCEASDAQHDVHVIGVWRPRRPRTQHGDVDATVVGIAPLQIARHQIHTIARDQELADLKTNKKKMIGTVLLDFPFKWKSAKNIVENIIKTNFLSE